MLMAILTVVLFAATIVAIIVPEVLRQKKAERESAAPDADGHPYRTAAASAGADQPDGRPSDLVVHCLLESKPQDWRVDVLTHDRGEFLHIVSGVTCKLYGAGVQVSFEGVQLQLTRRQAKALYKRLDRLHDGLLDEREEDRWRKALKHIPCFILALWLASGCLPTASSAGPCAVHERRCNEGNFVEICDTAGRWRKVLDCNAVESDLWKSWSCQSHLGTPTCLPTPDGGAR